MKFSNRFKQLTNLQKSLILFVVSLLSNLVVYLVFYKDINIVCRYLDGPHYLEVSKTFYKSITPFNPAQLPEWYFSVHLIGFPFFIRVFLLFLPDCIAMLSAVSVLTGISVILLYHLLREGKYVKNPFWLALVFIFFPPRWFLYHSVAGSEALFLCFVLSSLLFYKKEKQLASILMAVGASLTRVFGLLMFPLLFYLFFKNNKKKFSFLSFLIPLSLLAHFTYYYFRFGDFFSYFRWNVKQVMAIPFVTQILLRLGDAKINIGEYRAAPAEFFILICLITIIGISRLKKHSELFWYCILLFLPIPFLIQVDFSRFFIPLVPFAWLIAFEDLFDSRVFKIIFIPLIIVSYFYVINAIPTNLFPANSFQDLINGIL